MNRRALLCAAVLLTATAVVPAAHAQGRKPVAKDEVAGMSWATAMVR